MGKNVHKLSSNNDQSIVLFGISSHENDYRLSWAINEHLHFRFVKAQNHQVINKRLQISQDFSTYIYKENEYSNTYKLISNRCDNGFLLEEFKNIDFILIIEINEDPLNISDLLSLIKSIPFVSAVFPIELSSFKNKHRLL